MIRGFSIAGILCVMLFMLVPMATSHATTEVVELFFEEQTGQFDIGNWPPADVPEGLTKTAPIKIDGDDDEYWSTVSGNGTIENPYIIEHIYINLNDTEPKQFSAIWIEDTCCHFIIRNCTFYGMNEIVVYEDELGNPYPMIEIYGCGINLGHVENGFIYNCTFMLNHQGMQLYDAHGCEIRDNYFNGYRYELFPTTLMNLGGTGVHVHEMCSNLTIISNTLEFCGTGINTFGLLNSSIMHNHVRISSCGLGLRRSFWSRSSHCVVANNTLEWSGTGITLNGVQHFLVENNTCSSNWNGILLSKDVLDTIVKSNIFEDNGKSVIPIDTIITGVDVIPASTDVEGFGILVIDGSSGNSITENIFINNTISAIDDVGNFYDYNYWSDYIGYDDNDDGIGDTPYQLDGESNSKDYHPRGPMRSRPTIVSDNSIDLLFYVLIGIPICALGALVVYWQLRRPSSE